MKIKRLIIRNIASIEQGEIDFENGLMDEESGQPSRLFLITGDTGSGKSVILDCISMALYGTTPRVKGVNGVKNNSFKNGEGQEISVSDITQYTRIGISSKDPCYSELYFTGNDDINYVSKFILGFTNRRNLRKPEWMLTIGESEVIENRKDDIKDRIQKAVGLTFDQFSRMAMLAQGQFAEFLTGKKEERERILEQLTATDIFSRYGDAITEIFKKSKQEKETSASIYEEFGKNILSDDLHQELQTEQAEKTIFATSLRTETDKLRQHITHTEAAVKAEKEIVRLKAEETELKAIEETEDYRKRTAIITLWDETERQRKLLSDKTETSERIESDMRKLREMKAEFLNLSADLSARTKSANEKTLTLEQEQYWLKGKESFRLIFADSPVTIHKIQTFLNIKKESAQKEKEALEGKTLIEAILKEVTGREKKVKDKIDACNACQLAINQKSADRDALRPSELRKESERLLTRKHNLLDLSDRLAKAETEKAETDKAREELTSTALLLDKLKEVADMTLSICSKAEKDMKDAEARYMTMHLSVDKNFTELRKRLSEEHASNCPLCGQPIADHLHEWNSDVYFSNILSPLEEELKKLTEDFHIAKKESDEAVKNMNTTAGSLKAKEAEVKKREKSLNKIEEEVKERVKALEIGVTDNLNEAIEKELTKIETDVDSISEKLSMADKVQKEIDELIGQKEILDKEYRNADSRLQKSVKELTKKRETVKNAEDRIAELRIENQRLRESISDALKGYSEDWQSNPSGEAERLKKDADEFSERATKHSKECQEHQALLQALESLSAIRESLSEQLSSIDLTVESALTASPKSLKTEALQKKWNDFHIEVSSVINRLKDNDSKIKALDRELNEYYHASGKTETTIRQLLGAAKEVSDARILQQRHHDVIGKNSTLLAEAVKSLNENLRALNLTDITQLEDPQQLKENLVQNEIQYGELTQRLGVIKEKLEADEQRKKDSERQREDLERKILRFEKWEKMNRYFGGTRFRTLVQSHILRPLLNNANIYLRQITDHYTLTCSDENEQLSILVLDRYHNNEPRSATVLSGGERFMISLALSLALSAMNRPDLNVDILFIDEGFGTLDAKSLEMVMSTLRHLPEINGQNGRRVGVISHREELTEQIPTQIQLRRSGEGRSRIVITNT